jgi:hypothetical protein
MDDKIIMTFCLCDDLLGYPRKAGQLGVGQVR